MAEPNAPAAILAKKSSIVFRYCAIAATTGVSCATRVSISLALARTTWAGTGNCGCRRTAQSSPGLRAPAPPRHHRPVPDCAYLHAGRRQPGVTLELFHLEYLKQHPDGYRYTQFCETPLCKFESGALAAQSTRGFVVIAGLSSRRIVT